MAGLNVEELLDSTPKEKEAFATQDAGPKDRENDPRGTLPRMQRRRVTAITMHRWKTSKATKKRRHRRTGEKEVEGDFTGGEIAEKIGEGASKGEGEGEGEGGEKHEKLGYHDVTACYVVIRSNQESQNIWLSTNGAIKRKLDFLNNYGSFKTTA